MDIGTFCKLLYRNGEKYRTKVAEVKGTGAPAPAHTQHAQRFEVKEEQNSFLWSIPRGKLSLTELVGRFFHLHA